MIVCDADGYENGGNKGTEQHTRTLPSTAPVPAPSTIHNDNVWKWKPWIYYMMR